MTSLVQGLRAATVVALLAVAACGGGSGSGVSSGQTPATPADPPVTKAEAGAGLARRNAFQAVVNASRTSTSNSVYERSFATVQQQLRTVAKLIPARATLFTHSDFGRTLTSNGDGSDHAWGSVQPVVGGAVLGQRIYGEYPVLSIGSAQAVGGGRFIPTTSAEQYAATLARWYGVQDADLAKVAPGIGNFTQRNLGFLA